VSEPWLYCFIRETDSCYHEVDARLHHQVLASDRQAMEIIRLCQEVAQGCCRCQEEDGDRPISEPLNRLYLLQLAELLSHLPMTSEPLRSYPHLLRHLSTPFSLLRHPSTPPTALRSCRSLLRSLCRLSDQCRRPERSNLTLFRTPSVVANPLMSCDPLSSDVMVGFVTPMFGFPPFPLRHCLSISVA